MVAGRDGLKSARETLSRVATVSSRVGKALAGREALKFAQQGFRGSRLSENGLKMAFARRDGYFRDCFAPSRGARLGIASVSPCRGPRDA